MIKQNYDPLKPYTFVTYGRMSDRTQNARSPEQQWNTVKETIDRCKYPWKLLKKYSDKAITGKKLKGRPGFQAMLRDIQAGIIKPNLIVVDTYERFGRAEELQHIRLKLAKNYGILIVTADTNFADPTGVVGKTLGMIESVRSTEDGRVKAHNVIRGKKDTVRRGRWPGGPPPSGFTLKAEIDYSGKEPEVYHVLQAVPEEQRVMQLVFAQADATDWGSVRMTRWYNNNPEIPDRFKPISEATLKRRLSNTLYIGELVWGANCKDIIDDTYVVQKNPNPDEVIRIPNFCEPLVDVAVFERVQAKARLRSEISQKAKAAALAAGVSGNKLIVPLSRGIVLAYPLTGLVRCECGGCMLPVTSGRKSKAGKKYTYYACPRCKAGACPNGQYIHEDRLRGAVLGRVRGQLFPSSGESGEIPSWFPEQVQLVGAELERRKSHEPDDVVAFDVETDRLRSLLTGWQMTLGDPNLPQALRADIGLRYSETTAELLKRDEQLARKHALRDHVATVLNPEQVLSGLDRLADILAADNPTETNVELAKHIASITVYRDGRIVMRGTMLGLFEGAIEYLTEGADAEPACQVTESTKKVLPRKLSRRRDASLTSVAEPLFDSNKQALDPRRFAHVPGQFFWEESFYIAETIFWAEEHADELYAAWLAQARKNYVVLAKQFAKSIPTVRKAVRIGKLRIEKYAEDASPS